MESDELLCGQFNASLAETRRVQVTDYGSMSHQTHSGNRVRAGQARSTSPGEVLVIDSGTVVPPGWRPFLPELAPFSSCFDVRGEHDEHQRME